MRYERADAETYLALLRADEKRDSSPSPNPSSATDMQRSNIFSDLIYHSRIS